MATNAPLNRKLRMALVGGGQGALIGRVHCTAAVLDNRAALVAGALSSDPARAKASAPDYDIPAERAYGSVPDMLSAEKKLPEDKRIDFVSVATPNHTHFEIAKAAVDAGFNVICDKPMTFDLAQAETLAEARQAGTLSLALRSIADANQVAVSANEQVRRTGINVVRYCVTNTNVPAK